MQTPAWRLAESLRQRVYEAKLACEMSVGSTARDKLGELRGLLRLGSRTVRSRSRKRSRSWSTCGC